MRIQSSNDIPQVQLVDQLTKARERTEGAQTLCGRSDAKHTHKRLKQAIRKMIQFGRRLRSKADRRSVPLALRAELIEAGNAIRGDLKLLRDQVRCPDDAVGG